MITSSQARQWLRTRRRRRGERGGARQGVTRAACAVAAAGAVLTTAGLAGAVVPAVAATHPPGQTASNIENAGYMASGRLFRYASTTLTVPPRILPKDNDGFVAIGIEASCPGECHAPDAWIYVQPGGGPGSIGYQGFGVSTGMFKVSPHVGDRLTVSVYYDRQGHLRLTAADLTQHTTQTIRGTLPGGMRPAYDHAELEAAVTGDVAPPAADTRLWQFTGTRLTTYTGVHGTVEGPWQLTKLVKTTDGTATGAVVTSPSAPVNGGQDFGIWLRALPLAYTQAFAGYVSSGGPFRYIATTVTVPTTQEPRTNGGSVQVSLAHNGGPTPRPNANIGITPGGRPDSISYSTNAAVGTFTLTPNVGDQLAVSIFYDRHGHYQFTATDLTQNTTQTVTVNALYADQMPLNSAAVLGVINNDTAVSPPSDVQLWQFTGTRTTTYNGAHGSILGPWATSQDIDTTDGAPAGTVVIHATGLSGNGQNFGVWLRHR